MTTKPKHKDTTYAIEKSIDFLSNFFPMEDISRWYSIAKISEANPNIFLDKISHSSNSSDLKISRGDIKGNKEDFIFKNMDELDHSIEDVKKSRSSLYKLLSKVDSLRLRHIFTIKKSSKGISEHKIRKASRYRNIVLNRIKIFPTRKLFLRSIISRKHMIISQKGCPITTDDEDVVGDNGVLALQNNLESKIDFALGNDRKKPKRKTKLKKTKKTKYF